MKSAQRAPRGQWDALLARHPLGAPLDLVSQAIVVLSANAFVFHLLWTKQMHPFELVLLVGLEAVLLSLVAWVQMRFVPRSAWMSKPRPLRARLAVALFGLIWLGMVYGIFLGAFLGSGAQLVAAARAPWVTMQRSGLVWPLAIAVLGALVDSVRDYMHWRSRGGAFVSTPGFYAGARWLTLFLGGIPFFIPLVVLFFGTVALIQRASATLARRFADGDSASPAAASAGARPAPALPQWLQVVFGGVLLLAFAAIFNGIGWALESGVAGWAIGYCSAKLVSEAFITFLPLIASRARAAGGDRERRDGQGDHAETRRQAEGEAMRIADHAGDERSGSDTQ